MPNIFKLFDGGGSSIDGQTGSSFSDVEPENDLVERLSSGSDWIDLKVDFSDFTNFVTFNSAESYVTITADQILNEYPFGGTVDDLQAFVDSIDGYQNYFLENWPSRTGHLRLNPRVSSSYIKVDDFGTTNDVSRTSFLSPGTGSFSIQSWIDVPVITGSNDVVVVIDKRSSLGDGFSAYISGSSVFLTVNSGSVNLTVSGTITQRPAFFSAVCDRSGTGSLYMYVGSTGTFPTIHSTTGLSTLGRLDLGSSSFHIGSGSVPNKRTVWFTGSLDDVSYWSTARHSTQLTSSFNRKVVAQPGLLACWRFNDATQNTPSSFAAVVRDCSGHRLDGRIQNYFSGSRGSGSLAFDSPDPILTLDDPDVIHYVVQAQVSGALYDRDNQTLIWRLFPEAFVQQDPVSSEVFKNFSLIMARGFDRIKLHINQLVNLRRVTYGAFDGAPDQFLDDVGSMLGWDLQGSFIDADALKYFLSRDVTAGPLGNAGLDNRLSDIKSQFWKRSLLNLLYIYKTKGTRESIEALLRAYGVDNGFVRLKEYARRSEARIPVERITSEKSVWTLAFGSGSFGSRLSSADSIAVGSNGNFSAEIRLRFPGPANDDIIPTKSSGSIITLINLTTSGSISLWYEKSSPTAMTGDLYLTSSAGRLTLSSASIFDDRFYNVSVIRESTTGSISLDVRSYTNDELVFSTSSFSVTAGNPLQTSYDSMTVGAWAGSSSGEFWAQEVRVWDGRLMPDELDSHARDFTSYGRRTSWMNSELKAHWRLDDGFSTDVDGVVYPLPSNPATVCPTGSGFLSSTVPYKKFLLDYSYIPSIEYGWNQKKIRSFDGSSIDPYEAYEDESFVSLEFNMYDTLNEDISHLMSSYDELNSIIGMPVNKYRFEYEGLQQMRETYFKRLQGQLSMRTFVTMLDFFDTTFIKLIERLLPARTIFKGDEMIVESHMLERPKYQYGIRPIVEGVIDISGTIAMVDRDEDWR